MNRSILPATVSFDRHFTTGPTFDRYATLETGWKKVVIFATTRDGSCGRLFRRRRVGQGRRARALFSAKLALAEASKLRTCKSCCGDGTSIPALCSVLAIAVTTSLCS